MKKQWGGMGGNKKNKKTKINKKPREMKNEDKKHTNKNYNNK